MFTVSTIEGQKESSCGYATLQVNVDVYNCKAYTMRRIELLHPKDTPPTLTLLNSIRP